jgi:excisionase family DNA binding protein
MTATLTGPAKIAYSLSSAAEAVDLSESYLTRAIHKGDLRAKKVGTRYKILAADLLAWLESFPDAD